MKVKGERQGTVTDAQGKFTLPKGVKRGTEVIVTYVGMQPQSVRAMSSMRVELVPSQEQLDEFLVVAFGQQKKSSFTGSAGVVKADVLNKKQLTNVLSGLKGEVAGVQMTNTSGSPTSTPSFAIRGFGSINANSQPLIIVDGAPYDGGWNNLNPNDVESITVLKDAASNALYGARGANGVIMITTKKGSAEKASITLDAKWGANSRATVDYDRITDPAQYYELYYKALYNYNVRDKGMSAYDAHVTANNTIGMNGQDGGLGYVVLMCLRASTSSVPTDASTPTPRSETACTTTDSSSPSLQTIGWMRLSAPASARSTTSISRVEPRRCRTTHRSVT